MIKDVHCPQCGSERLYKDGLRYLKDGSTVQRWLCRDCGYRFSDPNSKKDRDCSTYTIVQKNPPLSLKTWSDLSYKCQVGACRQSEAKNLVKVETRTEKRAAGATKPSKADMRGKIIEHAWWLKKQGYRESTIRMRTNYLQILTKRGANLFDPESVKETIATQDTWNENTKLTVVSIYDTFLQMLGIKWNPPKYKVLEKIPFIPLETEIDQLISAANRKLATFLRLLKETAMRSGEAWSLKWIDIDSANNTIKLNTPEKYSNPRLFKVSNKLITMLDQLPKKNEKVFNGRLKSLGVTFMKLRKRLAHKLDNPRLLKITFHTFRHWKATMEYHRTKDILYVKQLLGHKNINNTLRYTQLVSFESDEYHVRVAKTLKEACELAEAGFDYFTTIEDAQIFRKRK